MTETEILIIGGGIAGVSAAYHLAGYGREVTLLERGEVAGEASGVNAGSIGAMGWGRVPDLQAYLTMGSLELFKMVQLDLGRDIELRCSGALMAIHDEAQYGFIRDRVLRLRAEGYQVELLTTREARGMEPEIEPALLGLMHLPLWAQADPRKATRALAAEAEHRGASILTGSAVTAINGGDGVGYRVETPGEQFRAETLVLAAGAWCAELGVMLGLRIPIVPVRGQMWATGSLPRRLFHTILSAESALHWHRHPGSDVVTPPELTHRGAERVTRHLYGRQTRDGAIIFGGDRQLAGYDRRPDPDGIAVNREHAGEVVPLVRELPVARTWAGLMPFTLDGAPLIGRIPHREKLYIVSGLGSSGFGRGPMAGKLIADAIHTGCPHPVLADADPGRGAGVQE